MKFDSQVLETSGSCKGVRGTTPSQRQKQAAGNFEAQFWPTYPQFFPWYVPEHGVFALFDTDPVLKVLFEVASTDTLIPDLNVSLALVSSNASGPVSNVVFTSFSPNASPC